MPKAPSQSLYKLVHSLSRSEKRYFKLYSGLQDGKEQAKYEELFDLIEEQEQYNEDALIETLALANQKQLSDLKNYLFEQLLRSLRNFHHRLSPELEIKGQLEDAEILFRKGLLAESGKILRSAKKKAIKIDNYTLVHEILKWELKTIVSWVKPRELERYKVDKLQEIDDCLEVVRNEHSYVTLYNEFDNLFRGITYRVNRKLIKPLERFARQPLLKTPASALSFRARMYFLLMNYQAYRFTDQAGTSLDFAKSLLEHFEAHPIQIELNSRPYLAFLNYYLEELLKSRRWAESAQLLSRLEKPAREFPLIKGQALRKRIANLYVHYSLEHHILSGSPAGAIDRIPKIIKQIKLDKREDPQFENNILLNLSILHFTIGETDKAIDYINQLFQAKSHRELMTFNFSLRILNMIYHYETEDLVHLDYLISNYSSYFRKNRILDTFERSIVRMFGNLIRKPDKQGRLEIFQKYQERIARSASDINYHYILGTFDLESWLLAKINGESYLESYRNHVLGSRK